MIIQTIRQHYPNAVASDDFINRTYQVMQDNYRLQPEQILIAHSICSDDVNNIQYPEAGRRMLGPFNLGGLDGYPFAGLTGMSAFAHHVPAGGAALVFHAPHIGITANGEVGKILRVGQPAASSCCGALAAAVNKIKQNQAFSGGAKNPFDYQQQTIEEIVSAQADKILRTENPLLAATEAVYEASEQTVDELVRRTDFPDKSNYIFVVGAIMINSDWQQGSFIELRRFDCLDADSKQIVKTHVADFHTADDLTTA